MHRAPHRIFKTPLLLALLSAIPGPAGALDLEYDVGLSLGYHDNLSLTEDNKISDEILTPLVRFTAEEDASRVKLQARGDFQYPMYLENNFDDRFRGKFAGSLDWTLLPERLDWVFQDYLSPQQINDLDSFSPDNEQQVNLFVTGPSLYLRFSPRTRGQFDLRYGNSYAETTDTFNGDRYGGAARVQHEIDATSKISGNLEAADIRYDSEGEAADYKRYDAYVGYGRKGHRLSFDVDAGYTQVDRKASSSHDSGALGRLKADWRFSSRSVLALTARYQYTDATQNLITPTFDFADRDIVYLAYPDIVVEPNVYRERTAKLSYQYSSVRTTLRLQPFYRRLHYLDDLLQDQDRTGVLFNVDYRLRPLLTLSFLAGYEERKYDDIDRKDKNTSVNLGLEDQFTRHWIGRMDLRYAKRDSNSPGRSYDANAVFFSMIYRR
jgi:hypothetical protein